MNQSQAKLKLAELRAEQQQLIMRKNRPVYANGVFERYKYPVLTPEHTPLFWRYDLDLSLNPHFMERMGVNAVFNADWISAAVAFNDKADVLYSRWL